ncbi:hypothetical protein HRbin36_00152 [bacterium HR36]|nr:hypothetical protein HRbin36_00152 [bacterium HR36]
MRKKAWSLYGARKALGLVGGVILSWGVDVAYAQAPLPPPPPGPVLQVPNQPVPDAAAKPQTIIKPAGPVVEQLTVPPFEKTDTARNRLVPAPATASPSLASPPSVAPIPPENAGKPSATSAAPPAVPSPAPAVPISPGKAPDIAPVTPVPPRSDVPVTPPGPNPSVPAQPSASPATRPGSSSPSAPPALLNPAVQVAEPSNKPAGQSGSPATPGNSASPNTSSAPITPVVPQKPAPAILIVEVPAQATLWIEDQRMSQTGPVRSFQSPPLEPGKTYLYKIRLSWPGPNGQPITTEHEITVQAGQTQRIDFRPLAQSLGGPAAAPTTITPLTPNPPPPPSPPRRIFPFIRPEGSGSQ